MDECKPLFYGVGFEISGDAAAAIQQSLQPFIPTPAPAVGINPKP